MSQRPCKKRSSRSRLVPKRGGAPVVPAPAQPPGTPTPGKSSGARGGHPIISACMIVKNEHEHLPGCLASIRELVDELIVVDTGSTDDTVTIAESFGAKVYHHQWENNFSQARNISIGYATGEWIFIIDADEELEAEDLPLLRQMLYDTTFKAISLSVYNFSREEAMYTSFLPSIRLFRQETGGHYEGIVHNMLRLPESEGVLRVPVRLKHYGYGLSKEKMARKIERTKTLLLKQLEENPNNGFAHFNLAQLLRGEEDVPAPETMDRVIYHAGRAVELSDAQKPGERHIHLMGMHQLATAHYNKNEFDQAEAWCHRALALRPDYLDPILSLGHIYSSTRRNDLARKYYLEYLDRQKSYDEHGETEYLILLHLRSRHNALFGLGLLAEMEGNHREAVSWYEKCGHQREDYLDLQYRWGLAHYHLNESEDARRRWEKQLEFNPRHGDSHVFLGEVLHRLGDIAGAERHLFQALELGDKHSIAYYRLAVIAQEQDRPKQALEYINRMLAYDPQFISGYRLRGDLYFALGDSYAAADDYLRCLDVKPDDATLLNNLGNCHFRQEDYAQAEELYRRAAALHPDTGEGLRNWGLALARLNRIDDACTALEEYLQGHPEDIDTAGFLGDLHCRLDNVRAAIGYYETVIAAQPARAETWLRLADCYHSQGHVDAALLGYERVLQLAPGHEPTLERLRRLREQLRQTHEFNEVYAEAAGKLVGV